MDGKEVIKDIKEAVSEVKKQNQDVISVDALLAYLGDLEENSEAIGEEHARRHEGRLEEYRANNERYLAQYNAEQAQSLELFRSVIGYGTAALKSAILINGGAAVALLAFIGNIWSKGIAPESASPLTSAITYFSFGVLAAAIGTAGSYLTQYCYSQGHKRTGIGFHLLSLALVIGAYVVFSQGVIGAHEAFVAQLSPNK